MASVREPTQPVTREPQEADTLYRLLVEAAIRYGRKTALQVNRPTGWTRLSYRELVAAAEAWGRSLGAAGLAAGERALLVGDGSPEWGVGYFAILACGATAVPLDPQLAPEDVVALAVRTEARIWLLSDPVARRLRDTPSRLSEPPRVFVLDGFAVPPETDRPARATTPPARPEQPDSILFTSGTTLAPKGVPLTHANFLANARALLTVVPMAPSDELISVLPMYHALGFMGSFLAPLAAGATITYLDRLTPQALVAAMQTTGTSLLIAVPRLLVLLVKAIRTRLDSPSKRRTFSALLALARMNRGLAARAPALAPVLRRMRALFFRPVHAGLGGRLRLLVSGGAALQPDVYDTLDLMGFTVCEGYGLTETSPVLTLNPPAQPRPGTVGSPLPGVQLKIIDVGPEGNGAVLARGACVFSGYLDDEGATQQAFVDGWFRTGDLGRLGRDGYLILAGRADDVIVTGGGKNVYPLEVEWLYRDLPRVKELCVIGLPDRAGGEAVHGVVVLEEGNAVSSEEARKAIQSAVSEISRRLPPHQRLRGLHFREDELPRTNTLKVKRKEVRDAVRAGERPQHDVHRGDAVDVNSP